jgi:hypothetical protein
MKLLIPFIFLLISSCTQQSVTPNADIAGTVTIGPLCGIVPGDDVNQGSTGNPCGFSEAQLDDIYGKYYVSLYTVNNKPLDKFKLDHTGKFEFKVVDGKYLLKIEAESPNALNNTKAEDLSQLVTIASGDSQFYEFIISTNIL